MSQKDDRTDIQAGYDGYAAHLKANIQQYLDFDANAFYTVYYNQDRFKTTTQFYAKTILEKQKKKK